MFKNTIHKMIGGPGFWIVAIASTLSQIGSGLSQVAVFAKLGEMQAGVQAFAIAVFVSLLPALFASKLAEHFIKRFSLSTALILIQILSAIGMIVPILGAYKNSIELLYSAEFIGSVNLGFMFPILHVYTNRCFRQDQMHIATKLDTILFSSNVILGLGLGSILYGFIGAKNYLIADTCSFLVSGLLFWVAAKFDRVKFSNSPSESQIESTSAVGLVTWYKSLTLKQKNAFSLQIFICIGSAPTSALLASFSGRIQTIELTQSLVLQTSVILLLAKATGQMIAPFLLSKKSLDFLSASAFTAIGTCLGFNLCYFFAILTAVPALKLLWIVAAHVFSNVLYATNVFAVQTSFPGEQVGEAFGRQYRIFMLLMLPIPFISGAFVNSFGSLVLPGVVFALFLVAFSLFKVTHRQNIEARS